jgi:hypothetical protein
MRHPALLACLPIALLATPLAAADNDSVYFGISPLLADYQALVVSPKSGIGYAFEDKQDGYKVFAGVRAGNYFGVELAYDDFGSYRATAGNGFVTRAKTNVSGGSLFAVGFLPIGSVDLFAKAGMVYRQQRSKIDDTPRCPEDAFCLEVPLVEPPVVFSKVKDHVNEFAYGGGAELVVYGGLSLRVEYERFNFDGNANVTSVGLTYHFN